jgi:signal transduction histidine kinase/ligand-binding sensor domain-containing protein
MSLPLPSGATGNCLVMLMTGFLRRHKAGVMAFLWSIAVGGTTLNAQTKKLYFNHLNTSNGLSQSFCSFIYRDSKNYIWISSIDGLMRFDGQSVTTYRPKSSDSRRSMHGKNVQSPFFEDAQGNIWFSTYNALNVYRRNTDDFQHFFVKKSGTSLTEAAYNLFFRDNDRLAVTIDNQALYWIYPRLDVGGNLVVEQKYAGAMSGDRCVVVPNPEGIRQVLTFDRATNGAPGFNIYSIEGDTTRPLRRYFDGVQHLPALSIKGIVVGTEDLLWLSTNKGLVRLSRATGDWRFCNQLAEGKSFEQSEGLTPDGTDRLWVSTDQGLVWFHKKTERVEAWYPPVVSGSDGPAGITADLYLDRHRVLWSSVYGTGVDFTALDKPKFPVFQVPPLTSGPFVPGSLEEDGAGNIWLGSNISEVLYKYTPRGPAAGVWEALPFKTWKLLKMPNGRLFVATMQGISFVIDPVTNMRYPVKTEAGEDITFGDVCVASRENLLGAPFLTNGGLWKITAQGDAYIARKLPYSLMNAIYSRVFTDKQGRIYTAKDFNSVVVYQIKDAEAVVVARPALQGEAKCFYEDNGAVWIGGEFGLCRLNQTNWAVEYINTAPEIANNTIYGILPDEAGHLWLSTNTGIIRYHPGQKTCRVFGISDGLQDNEYNSKSYLKSRDGRLWFGGIKGINVFAPQKIEDLPTVPNVMITRLQINDTPDTTRRNINLVDSLFFPYDQHTLSFDFVALEYSDPARNKLSYRLFHASGAPYDDNWVACASPKGFARYPNLPAGAYVLKIKGVNSDGVENPEYKELFIQIHPPFYQTNTFYALMVVLCLLLGYWIFRLTVRRKLQRQNMQLREQRIRLERQEALTQERNRIAAEMHDDFGSGLTAIQRISERTAINVDSPEARKAINNITHYSLELIGNMREIIWAMSGKNDTLENLMAYISDNAYQYLSHHHIEVDIMQPEDIPDVEMTGEKRRNIYLAVKESLHNIVKHAGANAVTIRFEVNGTLDIHVQDNGKGFANNNPNGNGMSNMAKRMQDIGGTMQVINDGGAHLVFSVPMDAVAPPVEIPRQLTFVQRMRGFWP